MSDPTRSAAEPLTDGAVAPPPPDRREWAVFNSEGPDDGVSTLTVVGEVDISVADEFVAAALTCLEDPATTTLRVDLAAVTFLDSSGLGALVRARNFAQEHGKEMVIAHAIESVMKVFTITGLADALTFEGTSTQDVAGPDGSADG